MSRLFIVSIVSMISLVALSGSLQAKPELREVAHVRNGIITVGIAYEISQKCGSISPRYIRGLNFLEGLKGHARNLGYTNREIDDYINDSNEKNRLEALGRSMMADMGIVEGEEATYCAVGRAEIEAGSGIGRLLR
ncbi:hypothetical protein SAMN05444003_1001 [Cognatiyoonia sediminum]|uniref:Uncharacterized protein n=1 Tax=Cognatiyoonia sediminum TaxID=1508389 RepID=A0A1M5MT42_9RHOB|nr:DUF5333 domain-containing protein [Cognatiyoonia sediminum]SHG80377.1 hypothetical protein SAMN05444003_1001 [Cognatiyoonia sediminum]